MTKVFVNIGLSLDGYMAPVGMRMDDFEYKNGGAKWGALLGWLVRQQYFRENVPKQRALEFARQSAGVVDELEIALAPVLFSGGRRLFENMAEPAPQFRIENVVNGPAATHVRHVRQ